MYQEFTENVWKYYDKHGRTLPWRQPEPDGTFDAYKILLSEFMLQQTQVNRVIIKYYEFLQLFPTIEDLANAPLGEVLTVWNGLGYNRRAQYVHRAAQHLVNTEEPWTLEKLMECKGIGSNTAAAIVVYAYNQPLVFVETNIRSVYIHHFFADQQEVSDASILELVRDTLPVTRSREWYWALMDYGTYCKKTYGNASQRSKHYKKQSSFVGSKRQIRGAVMKALIAKNRSIDELRLLFDDERLEVVVDDLLKEGQIIKEHKSYRLAD